MTWTDRYRERMNAENLAAQAKPVQAKAHEILKCLEDLEKHLYWAIEPDEQDAPGHWASRLIEQAHALVDLGHEYRQALALNPPPKILENNSEEA